jgi:hypothetical protein
MTRLPAIAGLVAPVLLATAKLPAIAAAADLPASRPLVNERCPVTVEEFATPSHEIRWGDYSIRFCCEKCEGRFQADPASYVANLPQLPPEVVERTILDSRGDAWHTQAAAQVERWTQAGLLALAGLIGAWLVVRIVRRQRERGPHPSS